MEIVDIGSAELAVDRYGAGDAPAMLLIAGGSQSMDWWMPEFCELLAGDELQVIRYDHRDTGQSSSSPPGHPDYTGDDLEEDPVRLLDALGVARAHIAGMSMGGGIAQTVAVRHPDRVRTLTLIETSPAAGDHGPLPSPSSAVVASWQQPPPEIDWTDEDAVIARRVDEERPYAGPGGLDEERVTAIATEEVRRAHNMASALTNHMLVEGGSEVDPADIRVPALVIHSADDPLFPLAHGEALARAIPDAQLLHLDGVGHEIPPPRVWETVVPAIREHARAARPRSG